MKLKCPKCKQEFKSSDHTYAPFCSERCRLLDLGKWASGEYKIESQEAEGLEEALEDKIKQLAKFSHN